MRTATPNDGHRAIAELEQQANVHTLVTQAASAPMRRTKCSVNGRCSAGAAIGASWEELVNGPRRLQA